MGISATWKIDCDGCGLTHMVTYTPETINANRAVTVTYLDPWGPGIPSGWLQVVGHEEAKDVHRRFFHSDACYVAWLRKNNMNEEADWFEKAEYIA